MYQSAHEVMIADIKIETGPCDPDHAPFMGSLPSKS